MQAASRYNHIRNLKHILMLLTVSALSLSCHASLYLKKAQEHAQRKEHGAALAYYHAAYHEDKNKTKELKDDSKRTAERYYDQLRNYAIQLLQDKQTKRALELLIPIYYEQVRTGTETHQPYKSTRYAYRTSYSARYIPNTVQPTKPTKPQKTAPTLRQRKSIGPLKLAISIYANQHFEQKPRTDVDRWLPLEFSKLKTELEAMQIATPQSGQTIEQLLFEAVEPLVDQAFRDLIRKSQAPQELEMLHRGLHVAQNLPHHSKFDAYLSQLQANARPPIQTKITALLDAKQPIRALEFGLQHLYLWPQKQQDLAQQKLFDQVAQNLRDIAKPHKSLPILQQTYQRLAAYLTTPANKIVRYSIFTSRAAYPPPIDNLFSWKVKRKFGCINSQTYNPNWFPFRTQPKKQKNKPPKFIPIQIGGLLQCYANRLPNRKGYYRQPTHRYRYNKRYRNRYRYNNRYRKTYKPPVPIRLKGTRVRKNISVVSQQCKNNQKKTSLLTQLARPNLQNCSLTTRSSQRVVYVQDKNPPYKGFPHTRRSHANINVSGNIHLNATHGKFSVPVNVSKRKSFVHSNSRANTQALRLARHVHVTDTNFELYDDLRRAIFEQLNQHGYSPQWDQTRAAWRNAAQQFADNDKKPQAANAFLSIAQQERAFPQASINLLQSLFHIDDSKALRAYLLPGPHTKRHLRSTAKRVYAHRPIIGQGRDLSKPRDTMWINAKRQLLDPIGYFGVDARIEDIDRELLKPPRKSLSDNFMTLAFTATHSPFDASTPQFGILGQFFLVQYLSLDIGVTPDMINSRTRAWEVGFFGGKFDYFRSGFRLTNTQILDSISTPERENSAIERGIHYTIEALIPLNQSETLMLFMQANYNLLRLTEKPVNARFHPQTLGFRATFEPVFLQLEGTWFVDPQDPFRTFRGNARLGFIF